MADVFVAICDLQKFVVKLRGVTIIRQSLGTALNIPGKTRWISWLAMVDCFALSSDTIKQVIKEHRPEFLVQFKSIYEDKKQFLMHIERC